jgi:hypothetical protein
MFGISADSFCSESNFFFSKHDAVSNVIEGREHTGISKNRDFLLASRRTCR